MEEIVWTKKNLKRRGLNIMALADNLAVNFTCMQILVTGGAGFVGSNLVDALIERSDTVVVWDNLFTGEKKNINKKAIFNLVDVANFDTYKSYLEKYKFDVIFHLAALARIQPSFSNPLETQRVNVMGTVNMLEIARLHKSRFIYSGSSTAYKGFNQVGTGCC
jgi:UDP-glucose 4-epimerase